VVNQAILIIMVNKESHNEVFPSSNLDDIIATYS